MDGINFDPTLNLGQVITAISFIFSMLTVVWWQSGFQTSVRMTFKQNDAERAEYLPLIKKMAQNQNDMYNEMRYLTKAVDELKQHADTSRDERANILARIVAIETTVQIRGQGRRSST